MSDLFRSAVSRAVYSTVFFTVAASSAMANAQEVMADAPVVTVAVHLFVGEKQVKP